MNTLRRTSIIGAGLLVTMFGLTTIASANHAWTDASGNAYHWARTTNPFTLKLGDNLTSAWDSYLITTSNDWTISSILNTLVVPGNTNSPRGSRTPKNCIPTPGRGEVCNYRYGANGWLGIASIWASGTHITQGTVKLNDTYFSTATYNTPDWKNLVMCQEVGHIFGLDHQDEVFGNANLGTCMDYTNSPATNQHPNAHDYEMLEAIYAHLDTSTSVSAASVSSATAEDTDDPKNWGQEVRRSSDGRASLFVNDMGNGQKVLRHVFWAEPHINHAK